MSVISFEWGVLLVYPEMKIIHEPPRRISVRLPYSKVRFTDYLFPGEDNMSSLPAREQLDLRDVVDEKSYFEALEMESGI